MLVLLLVLRLLVALNVEENARLRLRPVLRGPRASRRLIKAYGPSNATESSSILQDQSIVAAVGHMPSTSNCGSHAGTKPWGSINVKLDLGGKSPWSLGLIQLSNWNFHPNFLAFQKRRSPTIRCDAHRPHQALGNNEQNVLKSTLHCEHKNPEFECGTTKAGWRNHEKLSCQRVKWRKICI